MRNQNLGVGGFDEPDAVPSSQNFVASPLSMRFAVPTVYSANYVHQGRSHLTCTYHATFQRASAGLSHHGNDATPHR